MNFSKESFAKFISVGVLSYLSAIVQMFIYVDILEMAEAPSYLVTQVVIFIMNFSLARTWIYKSRSTQIARQGLKFFLAVVVFMGIDWLLFYCLTTGLAAPYVLAIFVSKSAIIPMKYIVYGKKVFA